MLWYGGEPPLGFPVPLSQREASSLGFPPFRYCSLLRSPFPFPGAVWSMEYGGVRGVWCVSVQRVKSGNGRMYELTEAWRFIYSTGCMGVGRHSPENTVVSPTWGVNVWGAVGSPYGGFIYSTVHFCPNCA